MSIRSGWATVVPHDHNCSTSSKLYPHDNKHLSEVLLLEFSAPDPDRQTPGKKETLWGRLKTSSHDRQCALSTCDVCFRRSRLCSVVVGNPLRLGCSVDSLPAGGFRLRLFSFLVEERSNKVVLYLLMWQLQWFLVCFLLPLSYTSIFSYKPLRF